jgi:hypothetical protein
MDQLNVPDEVIDGDRVNDKHMVFQNYDVVVNHHT